MKNSEDLSYIICRNLINSAFRHIDWIRQFTVFTSFSASSTYWMSQNDFHSVQDIYDKKFGFTYDFKVWIGKFQIYIVYRYYRINSIVSKINTLSATKYV